MHLYIHVPFCRRACHYCDFHFSTQLSRKAEMTAAMVREIELRADFLPNRTLETVYFGGGTPSLLNINELHDIFDTLHRLYAISPNAEITLEANPDDITPDRLKIWEKAGINRLSLGIQTFDPFALAFMNRIHTADHALSCVKLAQDAGFSSLTIDLMYGIPPDWAYQKAIKKGIVDRMPALHQVWENDLEIALNLQVPHISSYCLTIEEKTVFGNWTEKKKLPPVDDAFPAAQFDLLQKGMKQAGYEQYEVSNFALPGQYARHNTAYWQGKPYLGIGPSAHSYDGSSRYINVPNNIQYLKAIQSETLPQEIEELTPFDRFNELLLTGLRTQWGVSLHALKQVWENKQLPKDFEEQLQRNLKLGHVFMEKNALKIPTDQWLFADRIAADLFVIPEGSL